MNLSEASRRNGRMITVFATFLAFMGIGVVDPILPTIAEQIGASHWQVEMLFTAYIFTMAIMMLPSGILSGIVGDRTLMVTGLFVVTCFSLLCGFSNTILQLSLFRAGWGLGNALFFATAMTLLIALSNEVSTAVGLYEAAIGLGMAGGPLLGGILGGLSWRYPFYATGSLMFIAFLLVILFVRQPGSLSNKKSAGLTEMLALFKYKPFVMGAIAGMLYYYGFFTVLAYSPLVIHMTTIQLGIVFFGWGLCLAYGSALLSHQLEKKWKVDVLLKFGLILFALLLALLFIIQILWIKIVLIIASGLISGLNNALFTSYMISLSPYARSVTSGVYNFVRWLGAAIAPLLSGLIGGLLQPQIPFGVSAVVVLIGYLFMIRSADKTSPLMDRAS